MHSLESVHASCPYCGEAIQVLIDCSIESQEYIEDCFVCCRPIEFSCEVESDGSINLVTKSDSE